MFMGFVVDYNVLVKVNGLIVFGFGLDVDDCVVKMCMMVLVVFGKKGDASYFEIKEAM